MRKEIEKNVHTRDPANLEIKENPQPFIQFPVP